MAEGDGAMSGVGTFRIDFPRMKGPKLFPHLCELSDAEQADRL